MNFVLGLYLLVRTTGNLTLFTEFMAIVRFWLVSQASVSLMLGRATKPLAFAQSLLCLMAFIATKVFVNLPFTSFKVRTIVLLAINLLAVGLKVISTAEFLAFISSKASLTEKLFARAAFKVYYSIELAFIVKMPKAPLQHNCFKVVMLVLLDYNYFNFRAVVVMPVVSKHNFSKLVEQAVMLIQSANMAVPSFLVPVKVLASSIKVQNTAKTVVATKLLPSIAYYIVQVSVAIVVSCSNFIERVVVSVGQVFESSEANYSNFVVAFAYFMNPISMVKITKPSLAVSIVESNRENQFIRAFFVALLRVLLA